MQARLDAPGGLDRYHRRIATVEPVFSNIESVMAYRRASSRREGTVVAEVLLKVLAHNISRLLVAKRLSRVYWLITPEGVSAAPGNQFPAAL
jgi:hypothetical protein